jgi:ubiquitin carboxyl-terminal hydrolase 8
MDVNNFKNKGLSGLANLGNTCFMNSCMQVISHTYELHTLLNNENYMKRTIQNKPESALLIEWNNLRKMLWNENCIVSPGKFVKTVQRVAGVKKMDMFTGFSQNDVPEFLLFIIDCFHTSLAREIKMKINGTVVNETDKVAVKCFEMIQRMYTKEYSEIWNIFYAVHVSTICSLETGQQLQINPEPYFMIDLPIPTNNKSPSLIDCMNLYCEGEILKDDNAWFNEETGKKENIQKKISFWSFPNVLVIDLKRFDSRNRKNQILVTFPLDKLDLSEYVVGYKKKSYVYDLYGVCNHSGGVLGGHYTAYVKNANSKWYHYNDTSVTEVPVVESIVSPKAYCLFYRKSPPLIQSTFIKGGAKTHLEKVEPKHI